MHTCTHLEWPREAERREGPRAELVLRLKDGQHVRGGGVNELPFPAQDAEVQRAALKGLHTNLQGSWQFRHGEAKCKRSQKTQGLCEVGRVLRAVWQAGAPRLHSAVVVASRRVLYRISNGYTSSQRDLTPRSLMDANGPKNLLCTAENLLRI